jgi:hypothetical protein
VVLLSEPFAVDAPFTSDSNRSTSRDSYVTMNVANENVMNFLAVFTLLQVRIWILLSYHANYL